MNPKTNQTEQIGYALENALYRTNHGYDPVIRSDYVWNLASGAGKSSLHRYMQIYEGINALTGTPMTTLQAINITASAGSKGGDNTKCDPANVCVKKEEKEREREREIGKKKKREKKKMWGGGRGICHLFIALSLSFS